MTAAAVTAAAVTARVDPTNADAGAGRSAVADREQAIRILGDQDEAERQAQTSFALPTGQQVRL